MIKTEIRTNTKQEHMEILNKLRTTGFKKIADCMWVIIYVKGNIEISVIREW